MAFAAISLLLACQSTPDIEQETKPVPKYDAKTFFQTVSYYGASFSHDESQLLLGSDKSGIFNIYSIPFSGGSLKQLSHSKKSSMNPIGYFPKDNRFLFTSDGEGDELNHIYVMKLNGKKKDLTPGKKLKASFAGWNGNRSHFYILTNERNPKFFDVYQYSAKTYQRQMIFKNTLGVIPSEISKDGRWLTLTKVNNNADSNIFLVDLQSKKKKPQLISAHKGAANYNPLTFTPDSQKLLYRTDSKGEFFEAWSYDLKTKKHTRYYRTHWDISYIFFSEKGRYRVIGINNDAQTVVEVTNTATGKVMEFPKVAGNIVGVRIAPSESKMAFYVNSDTSPSNLYTMDLTTRKVSKLTQSLNPAIAESNLVPGHVVRYESFDGLKIPSILYRPWQASADSQVPAIVFVHGGPGGQSRKGYRAMIQHLVNHGYAVLMVNNRGSSGYGKTFFHLDDKKHGDVDLKDCIWGRKYLEKLPWVNSKKIAIMGGSYGGYMVAAALTFAPKSFNLGINIFGVTNWVRTLESIPPYWESFRSYLYAEVGDPAKEKAQLRAKSPLFHAQNIVRPLLVVQGKNDPRVLQVESDEIVAAAKKNKVPVEYLVFKDEGHGFRKRVNRISASESYLSFLKKHL